MSSIWELPDPVLNRIFCCCKSSNDKSALGKLGTVCSRWSKILDKYHGALIITPKHGSGADGVDVTELAGDGRVCILQYLQNLETRCQTSEDYDTSNPNSPQQATPTQTLLAQGGGDANSPVEIFSLENVFATLPCEKSEIRKLSFVGKVPLQLSYSFLKACPNLKELHFHTSSLLGAGRTLPFLLEVPTIKTLVIDSLGFNQYAKNLTSNIDTDKLFNVIIQILNQNMFPCLESLILDIPFCIAQESAVVTCLSSFLSRHHQTIKNFCYHQGEMIRNDNEESNSDDDPISLSSLASSCIELKSLKELRNLHIGLYTPQDSDPVWINFLIQQNELEKVIFTGEHIPFPSHTVKINSTTLTTMTIDIRDNVDCSSLKNCKLLKNLSLFGKQDENSYHEDIDDIDMEDMYDDSITWRNVNLINPEDLPTSLEKLRIHRLKIETKFANELICGGKWNKIQDLELIFCGNEGELGVPLEAVGHILKTKRYRWFQIDHSLNRRSVMNPKVPSDLRILAYAIQNNSVSNFRIQGERNALNQYQIKSDEMELAEPDIFEFPEEISEIGCHRRMRRMEEHLMGEDDDHDMSESGSDGDDAGSEGEGMDDNETEASSFEDISDDEEDDEELPDGSSK